MSSSHPRRVLVVGPHAAGEIAGTLADDGLEVATVDGVDAAGEAADDDAVGCVVTAWDLPDGTGADLLAAVDDELPVVVHAAGSLAAVAPEAAAAGVAACLPRDGGTVDGLSGAVESALAAYGRTVERARDGAMLASLLDNVPLSIYFKDRQTRIRRASRHMALNDPEEYIENQEGKVHHHRDDLLGKTDYDLFAPAFAERTVADDRRVMEREEAIVDKIEAGTTSRGETRYTSTTKAPRYDEDGAVVGIVGVTLDVTEREQHKRELQRQNERLSEFAEVLTHDLRNPLNVARGYLDMLEDEPDPTYVAECDAALDRIEQLVEEIRAFALLGRTVQDPEPVRLTTVATEAWGSVDTAGATLDVDAELVVEADPDRLQRALENLYRNAVEHGGDDVAVAVGDVDDGRGFYVADDGPGIAPEKREKVFERGYTTSDEGTGFGLAIVEDIAEAHDWDVRVAGDDDGARIEFTGVVRADDEAGAAGG